MTNSQFFVTNLNFIGSSRIKKMNLIINKFNFKSIESLRKISITIIYYRYNFTCSSSRAN